MDRSEANLTHSRQIPKLKSLLGKYRHLKTVQSSLLDLSELASTVSDINHFYAALQSVIFPLFNSKNFHIVLENNWQELELSYCNNPDDTRYFARFNHHDWLNTLTGEVYKTKSVVHLSRKQLQQYCQQAKRSTLAHCRNWLGVPLKRGKNVIGVIAIKTSDNNIDYSEKYQRLLSFISDYIVVAIDRVRSRELLENLIQERTQKLTETNLRLQQEIKERQRSETIHKALLAISDLTATVNGKNDRAFYQAIHDLLKQLMFADNFYVALHFKESGLIDFPYYVDSHYQYAESRAFGTGLTEFILRLGKPALIKQQRVAILNADGQIEERPFNERNQKSLKATAWLGAPLIVRDKVVGVIAIQSYSNDTAYQQSDLQLIKFFSEHIATAIQRIRAATELKRHNDILEQLVSDRTRELQESNVNLRLQIEERKRAEQQLYFEAHHDALTQLPNRTLFSDRLNQAIRHVRRHTNNRFAVLFIDLDRFKLINDTLGHQAGDEFLVEIAQRVGECIRDNDILARLGGDEFVILLDMLQSVDDAEEIASRVIETIQQPFSIQGQELYSNASIGIAICDKQYKNADELLRDADAAMYQAKAMGRGRYVFFDESMRQQLLASMTLEQELRIAVAKQQFELHYQEISNLRHTDMPIGYEAFLRWRHPEKGILAPSEFIQMAEETGLIIEIEHWVINQVGRQLKHWKSTPELANAFISINLSGKHIAQPAQINALISQIKQATTEPERVILEFTERAFSNQNQDLLLKGLKRLKSLGVKLALDDYGAGLSSLNFLHHYPFEFIKLDKSFIRSVSNNERNLLMVQTLTQLGNSFGFRIVAEGIESKELMTKLIAAGCEYGQGYFISKPHTAEDTATQPQPNDKDDIASCA